MSDLTYGVKFTADGKSLIGEAKSSTAAITDLKKSTDDLTQSSVRLNAAQKSTALSLTQIQEGQMGMNVAMSDAKDKAWALANGYKDVGGSMVKTSTAAAEGIKEVGFATARAKQEMVVLGRELSQGNFSRLPGTLSIIAQGLGPVGWAVAGVTAVVGAGAVAWYEWGDSAAKAAVTAQTGLEEAKKVLERVHHLTQTEQIEDYKKQIRDQELLTIELQNTIDARNAKIKADLYRSPSGASPVETLTGTGLDNTTGKLMQQIQIREKAIAALKTDIANVQEAMDKADARQFKGPKTDPNDTAVINMQTEAFKKQMEAMGASAAQTNVYLLVMHGASEANLRDAQAYAEQTDASNAQIIAKKEATKAAEESRIAIDQGVVTIMNETEQIKNRAIAAELENVKIGETAQQLADLNVARIDEQMMSDAVLAEGMRSVAGYEAQVAAIEAQIEALGRLRNAEAGKPAAAASAAEATAINKTAEQLSKNIQRNLGDVLYNGLQGKFNGIGDLFKQMLLRMEADAMAMQLTKAMFGDAQQTYSNAQGVSMTTIGTDTSSQSSTGTEAAGAAATAGWIGLAVVAAVGLIKSMGYDHGNQSAAQIQSVQATGEVFGDMRAKSATIAAVSQAIKLNSDEGLVYSQGMLNALQQMNNGINNFSAQIVRTSPGLLTGAGIGKLAGDSRSSYGNFLQSQGGGTQGGPFDPSQSGFQLGANPLAWTLNQLGFSFGKSSQSVTDSGLKINGSVADLKGGGGLRSYMDSNTNSSEWFGLSKTTDANPTQYGKVGAQFSASFAQIFTNLSDVLQSAGAALGQDTKGIEDVIAAFPVNLKVSLKGLKGQALADALSSAVTKISDQMAQQLFPAMQQYKQLGEDYITTVVRVANETEQLSVALDRIGATAKPATADLIDIGQSLMNLAGGAGAYAGKMDFFAKNFLTSAQQLVPAQNAVIKTFAEMNRTIPASRAEFAALMQGIDLTTASGQAFQVGLLNIAPAFNSIITASEAAAATADTLAKVTDATRLSWQNQLDVLTGAKSQEQVDLATSLAGVTDISTIALIKQVSALKQQQTAATAAAAATAQLKSAWQSVTNTIFDEVRRIRGLTGTGAQKLSGAQADFATATAQARAGDQNAYKMLPALSQALDTIAQSTASTALDLSRMRGRTAASLTTTGTMIASNMGLSVPAFASGGDHAGGYRIVGENGPEMEFTGPSKITSNNDSKKLFDTAALEAEIRALRQQLSALEKSSKETKDINYRFGKIVDRWENGGMPPVRAN